MEKQWIDIFHQVECVDSGYVAITDYTGDIPTTRCFTPDGECFGGTRTSNELTRAANIRITDEQIVEYLTKIIQHGYGCVLFKISRGIEKEIENKIREMEEALKAL